MQWGKKSPRDFPLGSPCAWLSLRWCFQLLDTFTPYFHWGPLTATDSASREENRLGIEAAAAGRERTLCWGQNDPRGVVLDQGAPFPQPQA